MSFWGNENEARFVFSILQAVEWKWTPQQVLEQEAGLLHDVMMIGNISGTLKQLQENQKNNEQE